MGGGRSPDGEEEEDGLDEEEASVAALRRKGLCIGMLSGSGLRLRRDVQDGLLLAFISWISLRRRLLLDWVCES